MAETQHREQHGDLIAVLSPSGPYFEIARSVIWENIDHLPLPVPEEWAQADDYDRLELRFSRGPRLGGGRGFVFGTEKTCDIVLPKMGGISRKHCALTFEKVSPGSSEYQLVFRNLSGCKSTYMTYNTFQKDPDTFEGTSWIVNSQGFPHNTVRMCLVIAKYLMFRITVAECDMMTGPYLASIQGFLQGAQNIEGGLNEDPATGLVPPPPSPEDCCMFVIVDRHKHRDGNPPSVSRIVEISTGMPLAGKNVLAGSSDSLREAAKIWLKLNHVRIPPSSRDRGLNLLLHRRHC